MPPFAWDLCVFVFVFNEKLFFYGQNQTQKKNSTNNRRTQARLHLPQQVSMHHYLECECQLYILMMHPNHHPSSPNRQNFQNKILWYCYIFGCHGNLGYAEYDMIYHTACQSHRRSTGGRKEEICYLIEKIKTINGFIRSNLSSRATGQCNFWFALTQNEQWSFTSNAPSQSVEFRNSGGLSLILTRVCWISSMEGMSSVPIWWSVSTSIEFRFLVIHEHIDWSVRYAQPHPCSKKIEIISHHVFL